MYQTKLDVTASADQQLTTKTPTRSHYPDEILSPTYDGPRSLPTRSRALVVSLQNHPADKFIQTLDANVAACLPPGCKLQAIGPHGWAYWTKTAKITVDDNGETRHYFLKLSRTPVGLINFTGEFNSMKTIHAAMPHFTPIPIAAGTYAVDSDIHFYLSSFLPMTGDIPPIVPFVTAMSQLHTRALSPDGKFGFHVPSCMGAIVQSNEWSPSWTAYFTRIMDTLFIFEQDLHGEDEDMQDMYIKVRDIIIPRLLDPLQSDGRSIGASFVHGDCWDGNVSVNIENNKPVIFDASGFYAHFEYDLAPWFLDRHKLYNGYMDAYLKLNPPSEPKEDFTDRMHLYGLRFNFTSSGCYLENSFFRNLCIETMKYLIGKYVQPESSAVAAATPTPNTIEL